MSRERIIELAHDWDDQSLLELLQLIKDACTQDAILRANSGNLKSLRKNMEKLARSGLKGTNIFQFMIFYEPNGSKIHFWIEIKDNEEMLDIHEGIHASPFVDFRFHDFKLGKQFIHGSIWIVKEALDKKDPGLEVVYTIQPNLFLQSLCSEILLNIMGVINDCVGYYSSAPKK
ncbi:MAG: hypothetical protein ACFFCS_12975 [Candidatus Hodarchaeota archaeon]